MEHVDLKVEDLLKVLDDATKENPFMRIFTAVQEELNKEGDIIDVDALLLAIDSNSVFEDSQLTAGYLKSQVNRRNSVTIERSFAPVNYI